jgi:hypothetical protein
MGHRKARKPLAVWSTSSIHVDSFFLGGGKHTLSGNFSRLEAQAAARVKSSRVEE